MFLAEFPFAAVPFNRQLIRRTSAKKLNWLFMLQSLVFNSDS